MSYAYEKINNYIIKESSYGAGGSFTADDILYAKVDVKENIHFIDKTDLNKKRFALDRITNARKDISISVPDFDFITTGTAGYNAINALFESFFGTVRASSSIGTADATSTNTKIVINSSGALQINDLVAIKVGSQYEIRVITGGDDTAGWDVNEAFTLTVAGADVYRVQQYYFDTTDTAVSLALQQDVAGEMRQVITGILINALKASFDQAGTVKVNFAGEGKDLTTYTSSSGLSYTLGGENIVGISGVSKLGSYNLCLSKIDFDFKNGSTLLKDCLHNQTPTKIITNANKELSGSVTAYSDNIADIRTLARGGTTTNLFSVVDLQSHAIAVYIPKLVIEPFDLPSGDVGEMVFSLNFKALFDYTNSLYPVIGYI